MLRERERKRKREILNKLSFRFNCALLISLATCVTLNGRKQQPPPKKTKTKTKTQQQQLQYFLCKARNLVSGDVSGSSKMKP